MTAVNTAPAQRVDLTRLDGPHRIRLALTTTDPNDLATFARDPDPDVRAIVATNKATPAAVLADLAYDPSDRTRRIVARHPAADATTIVKLTRDTDLVVQENALANPNTPAHSLAAAAGHQRSEIRLAVAQHPNTPAHTLTALTRDPIRLVALFVADNPNTPEQTLRELASGHEDGSAVVRAARRQLCRRTADTLPGPAHDIAIALLTDWAGTDADLVATAEAIARDNHPTGGLPHRAA